MESFIDGIEIGDELEVISDDWDISTYNLCHVGSHNSIGSIIRVHNLINHYSSTFGDFDLIEYIHSTGALFYVPPILSVVRPLVKELKFYSKSKFKLFDMKAQIRERIIRAGL